jgi:NADPH-dependent 2,4-dienoyl-CoA reductase/sulfur reductase-like enzyme
VCAASSSGSASTETRGLRSGAALLNNPDATVVVVGASLAGLRATEQLRKEGFSGRIVLIGDEPHAPYDRPPLTKRFLAGAIEPERLALRDETALARLDLDLRLGVGARALDLERARVELADGSAVEFDGLVIATGARPRTIAGPPGMHTIRTVDDSLALRAALRPAGTRLVVIGGGFLGLEAAATARELDMQVDVVEADATPLTRALGTEVGAAIASAHLARGVRLHTGVAVRAVHGGDAPESVELADGTVLEADVVLVAIGVVAETSWLEGSGLAIDDGLVTDETLTAAPGVVGCGDVVRFPSARARGLVRHEHWTSAAEQGAYAAQSLVGRAPGAFDPVAYFWSDQFDLKLAALGNPRGDARFELVAGALDEERFCGVYLAEDSLIGAVAVNMPRALMPLRALLDTGGDLAGARALVAPT